jgi:hypothetical protein
MSKLPETSEWLTDCHLLDRPITSNERAWIQFIRLASDGRDPAPTLSRIQRLRLIFTEAGPFSGR